MSRDVCWQIERLVDALIFKSMENDKTLPSTSEMTLSEIPSAPTPQFKVEICLLEDKCFKDANEDRLDIPRKSMLELVGNVCRYHGYESGVLTDPYLAVIRIIKPGTYLAVYYGGRYDSDKIFAITGDGFYIKFIKHTE
jgi:hypothetical protein